MRCLGQIEAARAVKRPGRMLKPLAPPRIRDGSHNDDGEIVGIRVAQVMCPLEPGAEIDLSIGPPSNRTCHHIAPAQNPLEHLPNRAESRLAPGQFK